MQTIGIFGGTFDPIHLGHLRSAQELRERLALDELRLLPCHLPPHRETPGCSSERRLAMVRLACEGTDLQVDDRELRRAGPSYTVETLTQIREELGDEISLCWVMGVDAFNGLESWHRWRELLSLAHIVVMARPGETLLGDGPVAALLAKHRVEELAVLKSGPAGTIFPVVLTPWPISATAIREALKNGQPVDGLMPQPVVNYIQQHRLYR